jgi:hypothetical protein
MKPESKSIFTSQREFTSQQSVPTTPKLASSTSPVPASPTATIGETALQTIQPHERFHGLHEELDTDEGKIGNPHNANAPLRTAPANGSGGALLTTSTQDPPSFRSTNELPPSSSIPVGNAVKHPRSESLERVSKRTRPKLIKPRHTLDPETFPRSFSSSLASPTSPLFFSHTQRQRPPLPPSFPSSDGLANMLNKGRDEAPGVTVLKLARGSVSNSPPRSTSTPGSWASIERSSLPRSPDLRGKQAGMQLLGSVGIIELLEQDERPTFIIDVANAVNFIPGGPLQIIFANASLRAHEVGIVAQSSFHIKRNSVIHAFCTVSRISKFRIYYKF